MISCGDLRRIAVRFLLYQYFILEDDTYIHSLRDGANNPQIIVLSSLNSAGVGSVLLNMITFVPQMHELGAFAYIDGGSGSLILQAAVAGFLGLAFTLKNFWRALLKPAKQKSGHDTHRN